MVPVIRWPSCYGHGPVPLCIDGTLSNRAVYTDIEYRNDPRGPFDHTLDARKNEYKRLWEWQTMSGLTTRSQLQISPIELWSRWTHGCHRSLSGTRKLKAIH